MSNLKKAMITNIQRCSVHDGPGIRTTIFMKGCNMKCQWCHNPETISFKEEYMYYPEKCIHCGMCEKGCFSGAKVLCGSEMSISEIMTEALLDKDYYAKDGGVTISGGEPTCQASMTIELLKELKKLNIHTAIESNLTCSTEILKEISSYCDLIMCDMKIFDNEKHIEYTGISNSKILENIKFASTLGIPMIIRTPLIDGVNDGEEEVLNIVEFLSKLDNILYYEFLPYHSLGLSKESQNNSHIKFSAPSKEKMNKLVEIAKKHLPTIYVAGVKY